MNLANGIIEAYQRKWSMINTFNIEFHNISPKLTDIIGTIDDDINLNIISFNTPDLTNDPIEAYIANKWFIQNGKDVLYRFSGTFRDQDQMNLYKKFWQIYKFTKNNYYDDAKIDILISKDPDWYDEGNKTFMEMNGVLIEGISNISFSNATENQIVEFNVNFKTSYINIHNPTLNKESSEVTESIITSEIESISNLFNI